MIRGKHRCQLSRGSEATTPAFQRHFQDQLRRYGKQYVVNLLHQKEGQEKVISDAYEEQLQKMNHPDVQYFGFDFNQYLGTTLIKVTNINLLLDHIQPDMIKLGFSAVDDTGNRIMTQSGVFRTNCLDCLDRTSFVQTAIARRAFLMALKVLGILTGPSSLTPNSDEISKKQRRKLNGFSGDVD